MAVYADGDARAFLLKCGAKADGGHHSTSHLVVVETGVDAVSPNVLEAINHLGDHPRQVPSGLEMQIMPRP